MAVYTHKIKRDIQKNFIIYASLFFLLLIGIMAGVFTVEQMKSGHGEYFNAHFGNILKPTSDIWSTVFESIWNNIKILLPMILFGMWLVGIPFVLVAEAAKGFILGFTIAVLTENLGFQGFLIVLLCIVPANIIIIPCYIRIGTLAIQNAAGRLRFAHMPMTSAQRIKSMSPYFNSLMPAIGILMACVIIEGIVSPLLISWLIK